MKHKYDDYILLSAYLDNELTDKEKEYIEKRLRNSIELQNKLEELKRIKEVTTNSKKELPENQYFEQRVMSALLEEKPRSFFSTKWIPAFGLAAVSLIIFVSLNINPEIFRNLINTQKNVISDYTSNLKPLFFPSEISNEDMFNFALYEEIPLNNADNQVLKIGLDKSGKEYFEVKKADNDDNKNNLNNFLSKLNLSDEKKSKVDSLFKNYASQLSKHILVGNENAIAINPAVWNLRKAMIADFIALTRQLDTKNFDRLANSYKIPIPKNQVAWNKKLDSIHTNKYIVFTPDSVFTSELTLKMKDFADLNTEDLVRRNSEKKFHKIDFDSVFNQQGQKVKIFRAPDFVQVQVEEFEIPDIQIPEFNSFVEIIEKSLRNQPNLNLVAEDNLNKARDNQQRRIMIVSPNDINLDSILEVQNRRLENSLKKKSDRENRVQDNSQVTPEKQESNNEVNEEIRLELEKLREEIEKFRQQFRNYIKEDSTNNKSNSVILIENIEI